MFLTTVTENNSWNVSKNQELLRVFITESTYQQPKTYRTEKDKVEYLYEANTGADEAGITLAAYSTNQLPYFSTTVSGFESAWLQHQRSTDKFSQRFGSLIFSTGR